VGAESGDDKTPFAGMLRAFMAARSRYAEDQLAAAVGRGATQCVILGAGLDTFAYRNPYPGLRVFEVDHPATQAWKREQLRKAEIAIPESMTFVPIDFETQNLRERLRAAGLREEITFFPWLGVTPYLTREAFDETIRLIASMPAGSGTVFDYVLLPSLLDARSQAGLKMVSDRVKMAGEPFRLFFEPAQLTEDLRTAGFRSFEDLDAAAIDARYFAGRSDGLGVKRGAGRLFMCATA
jgi:methyltransferase (TIGR00027 family)